MDVNYNALGALLNKEFDKIAMYRRVINRLKGDVERGVISTDVFDVSVDFIKHEVLNTITYALVALSLLNADQTLSDDDRLNVRFMMDELRKQRDMISKGS